jgi:hypothetical protein
MRRGEGAVAPTEPDGDARAAMADRVVTPTGQAYGRTERTRPSLDSLPKARLPERDMP